MRPTGLLCARQKFPKIKVEWNNAVSDVHWKKVVRQSGLALNPPVPAVPPSVDDPSVLHPYFRVTLNEQDPTTTWRSHQLYRAYLKHLKLLPDPHLWATLVPRMRAFCQAGLSAVNTTAVDVAGYEMRVTRRAYGAEKREEWTEQQREQALSLARQMRAVRRARKELNHLRAAVAHYPHALTRLLELGYGQRGSVRRQLVKTILQTSGSPRENDPRLGDRPKIPPCLKPLSKTYDPWRPRLRVARTTHSPKAGTLKTRQIWAMTWKSAVVPIVLPSSRNGPETGWEGKQIVESLVRLKNERSAHSAEGARALATFQNLPSSMQRIFPRHTRRIPSLPPYAAPARGHIVPNRRKWAGPSTRLTTRILMRSYRRLWQELRWVKRVGGGQSDTWRSVSYVDAFGGIGGQDVSTRKPRSIMMAEEYAWLTPDERGE